MAWNRNRLVALLLAGAAPVGAIAEEAGRSDVQPAPPIDIPDGEWMHSCHPVDETGLLGGGRIWHEHHRPEGPFLRGAFSAESTTILDNGDPANRVDVVIVGDGYTAADLPLYSGHAQNAADALFSVVPFETYKPLFNVHRVDVISNESGVDNDPVQGIDRDTAMDMYFFCGGIERALCVSVFQALAFADNAPDVDQTIAVANSTKYGGVGYVSSDLATMSGGNTQSAQVAIHEFGHTLGNLADEYTYGGPSNYTGGERPEANVSILQSSQMQAAGSKWAAWLGVNNPDFDGLTSTFEGGYYSVTGVYRPSQNSMMRNLNRPFNHPSAETLIIEMYKLVDLIESSTSTNLTLVETDVAEIEPIEAPQAPIVIRWLLDGDVLPGASDATLNIPSLNLSSGEYTLRAEVVDETDLVRDEQARATHMTSAREWTLAINLDPADVNVDGVVDGTDLAIMLGSWGVCGGCPSDVTGDGVVDSEDLAILLGSWG